MLINIKAYANYWQVHRNTAAKIFKKDFLELQKRKSKIKLTVGKAITGTGFRKLYSIPFAQ